MEQRYDLKNKKIAIVSSVDNPKVAKRICDGLHDLGASLTAITHDGQFAHGGWEAGKAMRFEQADPQHYDSIVVIADKAGTEKLLDTVQADRFVRSFFERKRPVSAYAHGITLLGLFGLLDGRTVSCDSTDEKRIKSFGATCQSVPLSTDNGLTTANSSVSPDEFILKVAEEVKEGRHEGQHA